MGRIRDRCGGFPTETQGRAVFPPLPLSGIFGSVSRLSGMPRFAAIHADRASVFERSRCSFGGLLPFDSRSLGGLLPFDPPFLINGSLRPSVSPTSPARQGSPALPVLLLLFCLGIFSPPFCCPASVNCPRWKGDPGRFALSSSIFGEIGQDGAEGWQEGGEVSLDLIRGGAPNGLWSLMCGGSRCHGSPDVSPFLRTVPPNGSDIDRCSSSGLFI